MTGTCQVCGNAVLWTISTLDAHLPETGEPIPWGRSYADKCAGSYKPPTESLKVDRPMTVDERRLSRGIFGP